MKGTQSQHGPTVTPLKVTRGRTGWAVFTNMGMPVGGRLLKGVKQPRIDSWGPFDTEEEAQELARTLTFHIMNEWPKKYTKTMLVKAAREGM